VLPQVIQSLVERRRAVKKLLEQETEPGKKAQLDVKQKALKITANSMYGCLGFSASRFYAKPLASLVTSRGRMILQDTIKIVEALQHQVIYGDTDSLFIKPGTGLTAENSKAVTSQALAEVKAVAERIKGAVNTKYKYLKIDLDSVFKTLLLLKKKKYAALKVVEAEGKITCTRETKGLDQVRRDWCKASRDIGRDVTDIILSGDTADNVVQGIYDIAKAFGAKAKAGEVSLEAWTILKSLTKSPRDYPDVKGQAHLQVALGMLKAGKVVNTGDHIPYVICTTTREQFEAPPPAAEGGSEEPLPRAAAAAASRSFAERAFHPDEIAGSAGRLQVDVDWYLAQQILPPMQRLVEPIEGVTTEELALGLGLDPNKFKSYQSAASSATETSQVALILGEDPNRFAACDRIVLECPACSRSFSFVGEFWLPQERAEATGEAEEDKVDVRRGTCCPWRECDGEVHPKVVNNLVVLAARRSIKKYYEYWLAPDDVTQAEARTRQTSLRGNGVWLNRQRVRAHLVYSARDLYTQLVYLQRLCQPAEKRLDEANKLRERADKPRLFFTRLRGLDEARALDWEDALSARRALMGDGFLKHSAFARIGADFWAPLVQQPLQQ